MINEIMKRLSELPNVTLSDGQEYIQLYDAMETVKRTLEQQPYEEAISRQAVLDCLTATGLKKYDYILNARNKIKNLPSVKPQEPKTVLYSGDGYADGYMVYDMAECPNCGYEYEDGDKDWGLSFCPNCGQALDWERSDKDEQN